MHILEASSFSCVPTPRSVSIHHEIGKFYPIQTSRPVHNN